MGEYDAAGKPTQKRPQATHKAWGRFAIRLPLCRRRPILDLPSFPSLQGEASAAERMMESSRPDPLTVLLVDDEELLGAVRASSSRRATRS